MCYNLSEIVTLYVCVPSKPKIASFKRNSLFPDTISSHFQLLIIIYAKIFINLNLYGEDEPFGQ